MTSASGADAPEGPRFRYAPSPTGDLHVGNARTALFNFLLARHHGGTMVLRLEDTDQDRSSPSHEEDILQALSWLGITWDEGPGVGGPHGPYRQSERLATYRQAAETLIQRGLAYPCTCSEEELGAERHRQVAAGVPPRYGGRCRNLDPDRPETRQRPTSLRFRVQPSEVVVSDLIRGPIAFDAGLFGDFVLVRSDGFPTYNFAAAVDDSEMAITHVVRGEDHLPNTPRQILVYRALGRPLPAFAHLPMVLGPDRSKLSKRHGATAVNRYRELGYLPLALVNAMALLGWSPPDGDEGLRSVDDLIGQFSLDRVGKAGAVFDVARLRWFNGQALRRLDPAELAREAERFLAADRLPAGALDALVDPIRRQAALDLAREGATTLADLPEHLGFVARPDVRPDRIAQVLGDPPGDAGRAALDAFAAYLRDHGEALDPADLAGWFRSQGQALGLKPRAFLWPIRLALTGETSGPELARVAALLGPREATARLEALRERAYGGT